MLESTGIFSNVIKADRHYVQHNKRRFAGTVSFIREDRSFINAWGHWSGRPETGGTRSGSLSLGRIADSSARAYGLTAAGHDGIWFALKAAGKEVVHLHAEDTIIAEGKVWTVLDFWVALLSSTK